MLKNSRKLKSLPTFLELWQNLEHFQNFLKNNHGNYSFFRTLPSATYQDAVDKLVVFLEKFGQKNVRIINWNFENLGENLEAENEKILLCKLQDRADIEKDFVMRFSRSSKIAEKDARLYRDRDIIEAEIRKFDEKLYRDLTDGKYDYGYLKRFMF